MTDSSAAWNDIREAKKTYEQKLRQTGRSTFEKFVPELFVEGVVGLCWTQYTPYFNDGEACTFSRNTVFVGVTAGVGHELKNLGIDPSNDEMSHEYDVSELDEEDPNAIWWYEDYRVKNLKKKLAVGSFPPSIAALQAALDFVLDCPEDVLEIAFGDHSKISVTSKGITIEEVEHD